MKSDHRTYELQLQEVATHLNERREVILAAWQTAVAADAQLAASSSLSRFQLYDHIPDILDDFEKQILSKGRAEKLAIAIERQKNGAGHGLHRWQQGYQLREVMREWRHLQLCLVDELEQLAASRLDLLSGVMESARRALAVLCSDGVCESAAKYAALQQAEAASRESDLKIALKQLNDLERLRGQVLREATHDLRGNVGVVKNLSELLNLGGADEGIRAQCASMLESSVNSLHAMLEDLMSLARLEAGHERKEIQAFDAAAMVSELLSTLQPLASSRELFLKGDGPATLPVAGDVVKTRRIVQNLVLNALNYTQRGGVIVAWSDDPTVGTDRWILCVQDTGPGFQASEVTPFARVLKKASREAQLIDECEGSASAPSAHINPPETLPAMSDHREPTTSIGEGVGLLIVKRLCDLLDASLELETEIGRGTTFRVILPKRTENQLS